MNKINPLYLIALLLVVLIISFVKVNELDNKLFQTQNNFNTYKVNAINYNKLTNINSKKSIDSFISNVKKNDEYKRANLQIRTKSKSVEFSFSGTKYNTYQRLLNEILNSNYEILSMTINKNITKIEISRK